MISRQKTVEILKVVAKGTWDRLPTILSLIPATAIADKVLLEVKQNTYHSILMTVRTMNIVKKTS